MVEPPAGTVTDDGETEAVTLLEDGIAVSMTEPVNWLTLDNVTIALTFEPGLLEIVDGEMEIEKSNT